MTNIQGGAAILGVTQEGYQGAAGGRSATRTIAWFVRIVVVLGALLSATIGVLGLVTPGALLALLGHPREHLTSATVQLAVYVGARELPIAVIMLVLLFARSNRVLPAVMLLFAASNGLDAIDALAFQRWAQLPGATGFAVAFLAAALWPLNQPRRADIA